MGKFNWRKPRLTIGKKGVKIQAPSASVGSKNARVNISKSGLSGTAKVGKGSVNTRRGCSMPLGILILLVGAVVVSR